MGVREPANLKVILAFILFEPFISFPLRIDHQRPFSCLSSYNGIIHTKGIRRQPIQLPVSYIYSTFHSVLQRITIGNRNLVFLQLIQPFLIQIFSIFYGKRPTVVHSRSGHKHITDQFLNSHRYLLNLLFPSHTFIRQQSCQLLSSYQPIFSLLYLIFQTLFLLHSLIAISLQFSHFFLHFIQLIFFHLQLSPLRIQFLL